MENFSDEDFDALKAEMDAAASNGFQSSYWTPKEGTTAIRIIPKLGQFGEKLFFLKRRIHYVDGRPYLCLNQTLTDKNGKLHETEPCPICAKVSKMYKTFEKGSEELTVASKMAAKDRYVARVIVRGKKDTQGNSTEATPEFWEFGKKLYEYFYNQISMKISGNFLSLKDGRDFMLARKGTGRQTDYSASCFSMDKTPVFTSVDECKKLSEELSKMDYKKLVEFKSPKELVEALSLALSDGSNNSNQVDTFSNSTLETLNDPLDTFGSNSAAIKSNPEPTTSQSDSEVEDIDAILNSI